MPGCCGTRKSYRDPPKQYDLSCKNILRGVDSPLSLVVNLGKFIAPCVSSQRSIQILWNLFPSTPTKWMRWKPLNSSWFQMAALQNHYPSLAFHSKPCVGPGCLGKSPLITKKFTNLTQTNKQKKNMKSSTGLAWISDLSFEDWFIRLLFLIVNGIEHFVSTPQRASLAGKYLEVDRSLGLVPWQKIVSVANFFL